MPANTNFQRVQSILAVTTSNCILTRRRDCYMIAAISAKELMMMRINNLKENNRRYLNGSRGLYLFTLCHVQCGLDIIDPCLEGPWPDILSAWYHRPLLALMLKGVFCFGRRNWWGTVMRTDKFQPHNRLKSLQYYLCGSTWCGRMFSFFNAGFIFLKKQLTDEEHMLWPVASVCAF